MTRGGRRQGTPGANYANRTDLAQGPRKLPIVVAPNQTYGEAGQQAAAQQAVPMSNAPLTPAPQPDVMQAAQGFNPPPVIPMGTPTMRPDEHVLTGLTPPPQPMDTPPVLKGVALLNSLGANVSPEVKALRNILAAHQANDAAP